MKIFLSVLFLSMALFSNGQSDQRFIEVIGTGEIQAEPDRAILTIELREFNRGGTVVSVDALESELRKVLTSLSIPSDQLTVDAAVVRQPAVARPGISAGREKQFSLRLTTLDVLEPLTARLREAGIQSAVVETSHADLAKFTNEARLKAIQDAREKAALLASAANVKVGRVLQIRELEADSMRPARRSTTGPRADRRSASGSADLEPINVTYSVVVRFMIE